ncbi:hypothetical protein V8D89_009707 [Ganoderma adspersum]
MPSLEPSDDLFSPRYLSPNPGGSSSLLKSPSRQSLSLNGRKSSASLRSSPLASSLADDEVNGRHSLAHELAAALLPEPSTGSKLLAEEFGIEYDEGAEGIDGVPSGSYDESSPHSHTPYTDDDVHHFGGVSGNGSPAINANSLAAQLNGASPHSPAHELDFGQPLLDLDSPTTAADVSSTLDPGFRSPVASPTRARRQPEQQDPMAILAADLEYTEKFLAHLRRLDAADPPPSSFSLSSSTSSLSGTGGSGAGTGTGTGTLERLASDVIRRINDATRDREGQVRELLEFEREFRKISADPAGTDALARLPELEDLVTAADAAPGPSSARSAPAIGKVEAAELDTIAEDANDWEVDPLQRARLGDDEDEYDERYSPQVTPVKTEFPPPPPLSGPATPAAAISLLTHLRTFTTSTASSLATISEHTQVNAAATTEAGRKIRALKNKLGGWRTEWDSAERSRVRIEKWEAGIVDGDTPPSAAGAMSPPRVQRRIDGRKIVQEHLKAFEQALLEANEKTQAIIAAVS